jgi:membrane protein
MREHSTTLVAAGVAFYGFLSFVPGLIALVSIYGLVADPADVKRQVTSIASAMPEEVQRFIEFQLTAIINADAAGVSITLAVSVAIALWSASGGIAALITGIRVAHEEAGTRSFAHKRGTALLLTLGAIVVVSIVVFLIAALPSLIDNVVGRTGATLVDWARWLTLAVVMILSIGVLYRVASGDRGRWLGVVTPGTVVAAVLWLVVSALFSIYTANFATYAKTYGSLASIVVLLLWLWLSALVVLIGAEVDAARSEPAR